jgi:V/A-type H+-transporting ATPase subunit K
MVNAKLKITFYFVCAASIVATVLYLGVAALSEDVFAQTAQGTAASKDPAVVSWGYLAAAIATGLSTLAAGIAVASVGSSAVGAVAEKPELFGRTLVLVGLAEGIAIYGLIISIIILNRLT